MESKVSYTLVGIFVITLIMALIFIGVWLSTDWKGKSYNTYAVYMKESVSGLAVNSGVKFNGVKVGYITSITLDPQNPQRVRLLMKIENTTPITETTTAMLTEQGLTGVTSMELHPGAVPGRPLLARPGELYPVIKTAPSLFTRLDTAVSELLVRLNRGIDILSTIFDAETQKSIRHSFKNIDQITTTLAANTKNFDESMIHLNGFLKKGETTANQFDLALKAFSGETLPQVNQLLGNLIITSTQLNEISDQMAQNPGILVKGRTPPPKGPGE